MEDSQPAPILSLVGCQALEQFMLQAKIARGSAAVELVKQALEAPGVYVFGELLETECVRQLSEGADANYVKLLQLFAYGTYSDYKREANSLPALTPAQLIKLKHLSIISLASKCQTIPYSTLLTELDIQDLRTLEDLIIAAIYAGVMQAKLDQRNAQLEVERCIGRDIKLEQLDSMVHTLENWCTNCASVLQVVEAEMARADKQKAEGSREKERQEAEVKQLWQTMKLASASDAPEDLDIRDGNLGGLFTTHQSPKSKGFRGSAVKPRKK